jgi:DNA-binding HxlR family transcriptional regulator
MGDESGICPRFHAAIELIGRRWSGAILNVLLRGPQRFNEILNAIPGLSDRLLTERLRELESHRLLTREVLPGPPVAVRYALTEAGAELAPTLQALAVWAERWLQHEEVPPAT